MKREYSDLLIAKQFFFSMTKGSDHQRKETDDTPSFNSGRWLQEEHRKFIEAIFLYGNEWRKVERYIKTRSAAQARSHAQKFFINIQKKYLEEHGGIVPNQDDIESISQCLVKFVINNLNCENISAIFKEQKDKGGESSEGYYKDDSKYKFMFNLQKLKNSMMSTTKKDFLSQLKEKFIKLILNLLHNTRAHNRKLATLGKCSSENNKQLINMICEPEVEVEIEEQTNPFYLCEFELENNKEAAVYLCSNYHHNINYMNDLYICDNDSVTSIFENGSIYNYSLIL